MDEWLEEGFKGLIVLTLIICILFGLGLALHRDAKNEKQEKAAIIAAGEGVVVEKQVTGTFDTKYKLVLQVKYEYQGESKTTHYALYVDEATFVSAKVGDTISISSLEITSRESSKNPAI